MINATGGHFILLITSGDPCQRPITPSNKHSQGGHESRGSQALMDAGLSCFFALHLLFLSKLHQVSKKDRWLKCSTAKSLVEYCAEAQQTYPKVQHIILNRRQRRENVLICRKDSWEGTETEQEQRVRLCHSSIHHWSFISQQMGATNHRDNLSVARSHLCPDVHSVDLLKEPQCDLKGLEVWRKKEVVCWNVSI